LPSLNLNKMDDFKNSIYSFTGGFIISVFGNIGWVAQIYNPGQIAVEWTVKVFGTLILGVIGGLAGLFAKDLYKWMKDKVK